MVRMRALWPKPEQVVLFARSSWTDLGGGIEEIWEFGYWWMEKKLEKPSENSLKYEVCNESFQKTE